MALGIILTALWIIWAVALLRLVLKILEHVRFLSTGMAQLTGLRPPTERASSIIDPTAGIRAQAAKETRRSP
jgi:hypothetical protein